MDQLDLHPGKTATYFQPKGCRQCNKTGYRGRLGISEVFLVDERIRELIVAQAPSWEIKNHAVKELGMVPLRQDGLKKVEVGITSLEDVIAVTAEE